MSTQADSFAAVEQDLLLWPPTSNVIHGQGERGFAYFNAR